MPNMPKSSIKLGLFFLLTLVMLGIYSNRFFQGHSSTPKADATETPVNVSTVHSFVPEASADLIRVGLSNDDMSEQSMATSILSAEGAFQLFGQEDGVALTNFQAGDAVSFNVQSGRLHVQVRRMGETDFSPLKLEKKMSLGNEAWIKPLEENCFVKVLNLHRHGKTPRYRGVMQVKTLSSQSSQLQLINQLPMQDYLRAVVPNELPIRFGIEAVKAQAVTARNYAVRPREKSWHDFDICDSQLCQAYYGQQTETTATDEMLEKTAGQVLLCGEDVALTLYSSSHGGVSTNYHNAFSDVKTQAFPSPVLPYLRSVQDDASIKERYPSLSDESTFLAYLKDDTLPSYDKKSPHFRWKQQITYAQLTENVHRNLPNLLKRSYTARWIETSANVTKNIGKVLRLEPLERDESGKLMRLKVLTSTGSIIATKEFVIRSLLRTPNKLFLSASIAFEPWRNEVGDVIGVTIYGTGFGHGVGMSQFGASGMNDLGFKYSQILAHYYSTTELGSLPLTLKASIPQLQTIHGVLGHRVLLHIKPLQDQKIDTPFVLRINEVGLRMLPFQSPHRVFDVTHYLQGDALNTLHWPAYPNVKVWLTFPLA
jgi:SpoIID/LytB domain protein